MTVSMATAPTSRRLVSAQRRRQMRRVAVEHVIGLAKELDARDAGAARHCATVARYSRTIAQELDLPENVCEAIHLAGFLHDVGKIGIATEILSKRGPLTDAEWREMQDHPRIGAEIVGGVGLHHLCEWVHAHHERPDGAGYPRGLAGEEIPVEARILAVADSFEAMTNDRVYREAITHERAVEELQLNCGSQFDEEIVEAFLAVLGRFSKTAASEVPAGAF
jgi:HD-GYP domain-containing protein (c-di-GMP phosphodiesterase class II)